jgi:hypothetical protein
MRMMLSWWVVVLVAMAAVAAMAAMAVLPSAALAAPNEPTIGLERLQELIDGAPSGAIPAYFKTVVKGSAIVEIPCSLEGIMPQASEDNGPLLFFQASGPIIAECGGIAAGMSGSPLYVFDGEQKLAGAVSYGAWFTPSGFGLATPIESMLSKEPVAAPSGTVTLALAQPVSSDQGAIEAITLAPTRAAAKAVKRHPKRLIMGPLATVHVSGIPATSRLFSEVRARLAKEGIELKAATMAAGGSDFATELVPGAAVAALLTRGDVSFWGGGTVTYTTPQNTLAAFGHPLTYDGNVDFYLANSKVLGVWNELDLPWKVMVPGQVRGSFTKDTGSGVFGTLAHLPAEVPVNSRATYGEKTVTSRSYATAFVAANPAYTGLLAELGWPPLFQATGDMSFAGNLRYRLSVAVNDGTNYYTVVRENAWDDDYDVGFVTAVDQMLLYDRLLANTEGLANAKISAVDIEATLSDRHNRAFIADCAAPGGLQIGENLVQVTLWPHGDPEARIIEVPLTLPPGTPRQGTLHVFAPDIGIEADRWGVSYWSEERGTPAVRQTLGEVVAAIEALPTNEDLQVVFEPEGGYDDYDYDTYERFSKRAVGISVASGTCLKGNKSKRTSRLRLSAASPVAYKEGAELMGELSGVSAETSVRLFKRSPTSSSWTALGSVPVVNLGARGEPIYGFFYSGPPLLRTTLFKAVWEGDKKALGASAQATVKVRAQVTLSAEPLSRGLRLGAHVRPTQPAGSTVVFERKTREGVRSIGRARLGASGIASLTWRPTPGSYSVRARFLSSTSNAGKASAWKSVRVR